MDEFITLLEAVVAQARFKKSERVALAIEAVTGLYPTGWTPNEPGILWQGFRFRFHSTMMHGLNGLVVADITREYHRRNWYGGWVPETEYTIKHIRSAQDMLHLLKKETPCGQ